MTGTYLVANEGFLLRGPNPKVEGRQPTIWPFSLKLHENEKTSTERRSRTRPTSPKSANELLQGKGETN